MVQLLEKANQFITKYAVLIIMLTACYCFFQFFYPYHLFFREQIQLFLFTPDFFYSCFDKPASLAAYIGEFLTQLFYLRGGGPIILTLLLGLEWLLTYHILKITSPNRFNRYWAIIPPAIDFMLHLGLVNPLSTTVGFIMVLLLFLVSTSFTKLWLNRLFSLLFYLSGYWLLGFIAVLFPLLQLICTWDKGLRITILPILGTVALFLSPLLFRVHFLLDLNQAFLYPTFEIRYLFLPAGILVAVLADKIFVRNFTINAAVFSFCTVAIGFGTYRAANFDIEKLLLLDYRYSWGYNDVVIERSREFKAENRIATYFTNMALARKGDLPDQLMQFYQPASRGLILPVLPSENWLTIFFSNEIFYLIGDMNMAQHSAMLGQTFSPSNRSSRMTRRLAEINLVIGDSAAAVRFLRILQKTWFHQAWANERLKLVDETEHADWLINKRKQLPKDDIIRPTTDYLGSLRFMASQNPDNWVSVDYLLCYHLLNKDLNSFFNDYNRFARHQDRSLSSVYAEALLIKLFSLNATPHMYAAYGISSEKAKEFVEYTEWAAGGDTSMTKLQEKYSKTYWFYYHFATLKKQ